MSGLASVASAAAAIAAREVSSRELVRSTLERAEATERAVHAYAHLDAEGALSAADAADRGTPQSPLHGIPFGVKEVIAVAGMPTACGSRLFADRVAREDAGAVARLRSRGAIPLGQQVSHELTCGLDEPPTRNPWDVDRYPGGSSAGGGVSVTVGSALFALGTDAAGSVRIPAAMTGVVGLKPTYGRIDSVGVERRASAPTIDHVGLITRTVADSRLVLEAFVGPLRSEAADEIRVGVVSDLFGVSPSPEVARRYREAQDALESIGAELVEVALPAARLAREAIFTIFPAELGASHRALVTEQPTSYSTAVRRLIQLGLLLPASQLAAADRLRTRLDRELHQVFASLRLSALALPTTPVAAPRLGELDPERDLAHLIPYTCPFNLTGWPAISIPCGLTAEGLPVGLQLVAQPLDEGGLLRVAEATEAALRFDVLPPIVSM
jgi:aspartyl-tRNA(Asn)/glutamyl-tRNA(Gln) amidotransferase subunit A